MKDTALPSGWTKTNIGTLLEVHDRRRVPLNASERSTRKGPYPYYGANGQVDSIDDFLFDGDYILLAEDGGHFTEPARGVAYTASGKFWVNNHAHILSTPGDLDPRFFVHRFNSMEWTSFVTGTTRLKLTQGAMAKVVLPLPPLNEQRRIVAKIDALQARSRRAREALEAIPALLDRFRQSVLAAAFRGDLTAQWRAAHPEVEPASVLLKRIRAERKTRWIEAQAEKARARAEAKATKAGKPWTAEEDAAALKRERAKATTKYTEPEPVDPVKEGLPELPAGWCWAKSQHLCASIESGSTPPSQFFVSDDRGAPFLKVYNLTFDGSLDLTINPTYIDTDYNRLAMVRSWTRPGDVLTNIVGPPLGKVSEVPDSSTIWNINQAIARFRPLSEIASRFMSLYLQSPHCKHWLHGTAKTTTSQVNLSISSCRAIPVPVPPQAEQTALASILDASLGLIASIEKQSYGDACALQRLDQSILAKAFRGELVPQDPDDEPASELLKRIQAERAAAEAAKPKRGRKKKPSAKTKTAKTKTAKTKTAKTKTAKTKTAKTKTAKTRTAKKASTSKKR